MTTDLNRFLGRKVRGLICLLGLLSWFAWSPVLHAAPAKTQVSKQKKVQVSKHKKAQVVAKHRVKKQFAVVKRKATPVRQAKAVKRKAALVRQAYVVKPSVGQMAGLHQASDDLNLKSSVAYVIDQDTHEVLISKNDQAVLPIASLTKLMTGLIVSEANLPMDETIAITQQDVDTEKGSSSRLRVGAELTRGELLHLALMSSENRAAHALGRTYPGGLAVFTRLMNGKALMLGMKDTRFVEPTGLSSSNVSSARDLAKLVDVAHQHPLLRELSTSTGHQVAVGNRVLQYNNTNRLVKNPSWDIGLQKTGYISEAGRRLVMQTKVAGRQLIMVFLDSAGKLSRLGDAERVRQWVESAANAAVFKPQAQLTGG
jgi:D-alanyl-D-alanine endopeptidase (penicillin-binding protein 7)